MDKAIIQSVSESFARMRQRRKIRNAANVTPSEPCGNCGGSSWQAGLDGEWYCFICGNRGYWNYGVFSQGGKLHGRNQKQK